jgi:salicylate hydroxylase
MRIGVVGAGIGGLTAAIALQQRGFQVVIFEQSKELGEIGAGITMSTNAGRVLDAIGLGDDLEAMDAPCPNIGALDYKTGAQLAYTQNNLDIAPDEYRVASRQVHRADLHKVLVSGLASDQEPVRLDHRLTSIVQNDRHVSFSFANGATETCDVVIACDGLKSVVRDEIFSAEAPKFTGFVAWRGLVETTKVPQVDLDPHFAVYSSADKMFARYPVRNNELINYVAIARKPEFQLEGWDNRAEVSEVLAEFEGWHQDVGDIIGATPADQSKLWALFTREPLDSWINGRVTLLGDAAHPMTPFFGMGAAMAIEDAYILARCFEAEDDWQQALKRYENARLSRANDMQLISRKRAEAYMSNNRESRGQPPSAGLGNRMDYNALTVPI